MIPISVIIFLVAFVGIIILLSRQSNALDTKNSVSSVDSVRVRKKLDKVAKNTYEKAILWTTKNGWRLMHGIENKVKVGKDKIESFMAREHEENMKKTKKSKAKHLLDLRKKLDENDKLDNENE